MLLLSHHLVASCKSQLRFTIMLSTEVPENVKVASSANISSTDFCISSDKSFIHSMKSSGPRTDPCGTPDDMCLGLDSLPEIETCCDLSLRYELNQDIVLLLTW